MMESYYFRCGGHGRDMTQQSKAQLKRQSKPKVKTGCLKCKERRIKCDETKPHCRRCMNAFYTCPGYAPSKAVKKGASSPSTLVPLRPRPSLIRTPDIQLSADREERRYFYLYRQDTATILSGYFYSDFWSRLVPQTVHDSAPVSYAVAAVSALQKCLETTTRSPLLIDAHKQMDHLYQFALRKYHKAVIALQRLLSTNGPHHRTALIASILFISIKSLQGDLVNASKHFAGAFCIAAEARASLNSSRRGRANPSTIDDELIDLFNGLDVQSKLPLFYASPCPAKDPASIVSSTPPLHVPNIVSSFTTTDTAKASMDTILNYINRSHSESSHGLERIEAITVKSEAMLNQWGAAFSPLFQKANALFNGHQNPPIDSKYFISHYILASTHALATIIVKSNANRCSEMLYDSFSNEFQRILDYSILVIDAMCSGSMPKYSFEVGVFPPLHVAAMKFRDPKLRREAIKLLRRCPAQEGVWEGYGCAKACEWIMIIEECGLADGSQGRGKLASREVDFIPEWNRVRLSSMVCWLHETRICSQCTSVMPVLHGSPQVWERTFRW